MIPATTLVLPTLRECPPMTRVGMEEEIFTRNSFLSPEPRQRRQFLQILLDRPRRRAPEHHALAANHLLARNPALRAQNRARLDAHMVGDAHLPPDHHPVFHHRAA